MESGKIHHFADRSRRKLWPGVIPSQAEDTETPLQPELTKKIKNLSQDKSINDSELRRNHIINRGGSK